MTAQNPVLGLHHVTAFSGPPQKNVDFYAGALGLRIVKVTVNHDDVKTYHLYYGTGDARPGSFITFFPWPEHYKGRVGHGQSTVTAYSVPAGSLEFWKDRLTKKGIETPEIQTDVFGDRVLTVADPDEATVRLVESAKGDPRPAAPWSDVPADKAILGFHSVVFTVADRNKLHPLLTETMGYRILSEHDNLTRYVLEDGLPGQVVDVLVNNLINRGLDGVGATHHVAFRTRDDDHEMALRADIEARGLHITPQIDRMYFHSLYFRTPAGPLFEIATDPPGMGYDEPMESLGTTLVLPEHAKPHTEAIRQGLESFVTPDGVQFP